MKITVEFDTWDEMEAFRTSGKKTRGKGQKDETDEVAGPSPAPVEQMAQPAPAQTFTPSAPPPSTGFPGSNGANPAPASPMVAAVLARIDGAVATGQSSDDIVRWFRQQIGPEAKDATLEQLKQVFIPRMTKAQLDQLAPQLGIPVQ